MNRRYEQIQDLIKNVEKVGVNEFFFCLLDESVPVIIRLNICHKLADIIGVDSHKYFDVKMAYYKLEEDKKQKVFNELISYLKSTFLDFEREKIQLISKKGLKELIEYKEKIARIYEHKDLNIKLLKKGFTGIFLENKTIASLLENNLLKVDCTLSVTDEYYAKLEFDCLCTVVKQIKENETYYEFIIRAIEEINEENKFVEFVWDKDEE